MSKPITPAEYKDMARIMWGWLRHYNTPMQTDFIQMAIKECNRRSQEPAQ